MLQQQVSQVFSMFTYSTCITRVFCCL